MVRRRSPRSRRPFSQDDVPKVQTALKELPVPPEISVHKGNKIQAALCVERPPTRVVIPDYVKRWRDFVDDWEKQTGNDLNIDDDLVKMRFHFHFLDDPAAARLIMGTQSGRETRIPGFERRALRKSSNALLSGSGRSSRRASPTEPQDGADLGMFLTDEGIDLKLPSLRRTRTRQRRTGPKDVKKVDDSDMRSLVRLETNSLYLLVKYAQGQRWTFPKANRLPGEPMQETLRGLCHKQLGPDFKPFIVGACPFSYQKRRSNRHPGIEGRKIFFYRARHLPGTSLEPPADGNVVDWVWCSRVELSKYLSPNEWHAVCDSIPLDALT